jgi:hypothetical protein
MFNLYKKGKNMNKNKKFIYLSIFFSLIFIFYLNLISSWNFEGNSVSVTTLTGNATNFTQLLDTPNSYVGSANLCVLVNGAENALVFSSCSAAAGIQWSDAVNGTLLLTATWNTNYTANNDKWLNTTNITYHLYNSTGLIKDWNVSGYIKN